MARQPRLNRLWTAMGPATRLAMGLGPRLATRLVPGLAAALLLAGCEAPGFSNREAELERLRGERGFAVLERGAARTVFAANGREVAVEPPDGYCLDEESIAVTRRSAFVLVADCIHDHEAALANGESSDHLPRAFPGILTVTVSGEAAFGDQPGALATFQSLLGSEAGGRLLGRGDSSAPGDIVAMRRVDGTLYVLIEETPAEGSESILAPRFWRAFAEVNGRLVLVTVSGFNDRPLGEGEMLTFLAAQMGELRQANGQPASADETRIARAMTAPSAGEQGAAARDADGDAEGGTTAGSGQGEAPGMAPVAPRRPG